VGVIGVRGDVAAVARVQRALDPGTWVVTTEVEEASVVVLPIEEEELLVRALVRRRDDPSIVVIGYATTPDQGLWRRAERLGLDRVVNVGALTRTLREVLQVPGRRIRRVVVGHVGDLAGRLGMLGEIEVDGEPFVLVRVEGRWVCLEARCPHQGASLSAAGCDEGIVTCPRHGSRFECATGTRVRGPADRDLVVLPVSVEGDELVVRHMPGR
jgi:nitrite reductase/ring-hydroxylating ferredoxin subunit